jgi:hypothetical protein
MRGKKRTKEEWYELFSALESYLEMGFSLKKACSLADVPYSTMRDISSLYEPLRFLYDRFTEQSKCHC